MQVSPMFNLLIAPIRRFLQNVQHKRDDRLSRESRFILEGDNFEFLDLATQNHEIIKPALIEKARGLIAKRNKAHKKKAIYLGRLGSIYNYLMQSDSSLHGLY